MFDRSDYKDNVHWFQALEGPAFIFNIHVMGIDSDNTRAHRPDLHRPQRREAQRRPDSARGASITTRSTSCTGSLLTIAGQFTYVFGFRNDYLPNFACNP